MPFTRRPFITLHNRATGELPIRLRADQDAVERRMRFEPRAGVDRIADERVGDVAMTSELAKHRLARIHSDTRARPPRALVGKPTEFPL